MEKTIYIRMRNRVHVQPHETVYLQDIAQIIAHNDMLPQIKKLQIHRVAEQDRNFIVIDVMKVVRLITELHPGVEVQTVGPPQTIIEVIYKRKRVSFPAFLMIWFLLFFGAALAIMNFHEDVSMQDVHQHIYTIITGKVEKKPLLFQIPYSFGLGLGMILFFNHVFRKRINEEPSPMEVEIFNYQQSLDQYVAIHENKESTKHLNDH